METDFSKLKNGALFFSLAVFIATCEGEMADTCTSEVDWVMFLKYYGTVLFTSLFFKGGR